MHRTSRALRTAAGIAGAVTVLAAAGCSDSSSDIKGASVHKAAPSATDGPALSPGQTPHDDSPSATSHGAVPHGHPGRISWTVRDPRPGTVTDVVNSYHRFVTLTIDLLAAPRPDDPRIGQYATDTAASALTSKLTALQRSGYVETGPVRFRPRVVAADPVSGDATVDDCADYSHFGYAHQKTKGRAAQPLRATLHLTTGHRWQVTSWQPASAEACS